MKYILFLVIIIGTLVIALRQPANKVGSALFIIYIGFALLSAVAKLPDPEISSSSSYTPKGYSSCSSYSNRNAYSSTTYARRRALTKEEADALHGTGYNGTKPNSAAECMELKATQVACKECGYHSDNGSNSLCDYCQAKAKP